MHSSTDKMKTILAIYSETKNWLQIANCFAGHAEYHLIHASSAKHAFEIIEHTMVDCILTDINIRDMDGWRISRLIRSGILKIEPNTPIIVASQSFSDRIAEATAKEFQINYFVNFYEIQSLPDIVNHVLDNAQQLSQSRILLIEDTQDTIKLVKRFLGQRYSIDVAETGSDGLKAWHASKYDLVLLDVMLPGMSGEQVLENILAEDSNQSIVIMTAHGNAELASKLMLKGAIDFISKPFRADNLRQVCEIALHRQDYLISHEQISESFQRLENSQASYRRLIESLNSDHFFYTQTPEGKFSYISPSIENVLDYTPTDFSNNFMTLLTDNPKNELSLTQHKACVTEKQQQKFEIELYDGTGRVRYLEITESPIINPHDEVTAVDGIVHDITQRYEQHIQLQKLADATSEGILIHDQGHIIEANHASEKMFQLERNGIIGKPLTELIQSDNLTLPVKFDLDTNRSFEANAISSDSRNFPVDIRMHSITVDGKQVQVAAITDLTEQKKINKERETMQNQLRQAQKMEAIGHLTGGIAHDFNNILASITGYTGLAIELFAKEGKLNQYLSEVSKAAERARQLVAQMLTFSRGGSANPQAQNPAPLINDAIKMLRSTLPTTIKLDINLPDKPPQIHVDAIQFHQLIMNICINARDAINKDDGHIQISLENVNFEAEHCSSCHQDIKGKFVRIDITDNGDGIPEATLNKIFDPFFTTKDIGKGTGMGLSVVHGIMHDHGGHLLVSSAAGQGTRFSLLFPLHERQKQAVTVKQKASDLERLHGNGRIMVVDDDPVIATYLKEFLTTRGYSVTTFIDPCEALGAFNNKPNAFDLVVTDQTMPMLPGHKLAQALLKRRPEIPIILCTGYSDVIDETKAHELHIRGFMQKPLQADTLISTMQNLMVPNESYKLSAIQ